MRGLRTSLRASCVVGGITEGKSTFRRKTGAVCIDSFPFLSRPAQFSANKTVTFGQSRQLMEENCVFRPTFTPLENPLTGKDKNSKFLESTFVYYRLVYTSDGSEGSGVVSGVGIGRKF